MNASQPIAEAAAVAPTGRSFPTGRGKEFTHSLAKRDGTPNRQQFAGQPYPTVTGADIARMVENPPSAVPKDQAQWFIPSTYAEHDARSHEAQEARGSFLWLTLDVDGNNLALIDVAKAIGAVLGPCRYLIYSTSSATPDNRKWRALVPLKEPLLGADFKDTQRAFFDLLLKASSGTLIADRALERTGQPVYLPNPLSGFYDKAVKRDAPQLDLVSSHPVILRREESRAKRAEAEMSAVARRRQLEAERAARPFGEADSPIEAFNARHAVADLLERYGYVRAGRSDDWRSPYQSSGSYATRDMGEYWVSLSGSDASAGLGHETRSGARHGDAFDLYCHFDHGGKTGEAAKVYWGEMHPPLSLSGNAKCPAVVPMALEYDPGPDPTEKQTVENLPASKIKAENPVEFVLGRGGKPAWCAENACLTLERHPDWAGVLAHDEFAVLDLLMKPIPGTTVPHSRFKPRELQEHDVTAALRWFNRNRFPDATRNVLQDAMQMVARQSIISPLRHYLEALKWDGTPRIEDWLQVYCEAPSAGLTRRFGRKWLIAAVARALRPGCKADNALVLEGAQGIGKSSALKALAGEEWFFDGLRDMHGKDASASLKGKWIVELPELSALRRSDVEAVKAFLSRTEERYRPPYGRGEVIERRRCIFAGTTNRDDYLADDTGGRRFWPVRVGQVDVKALKRDRDQIWAEAVEALNSGESWWLSGEEEAGAAAIVADRQAEDLWSGKVLSVAAGLPEVSASQILTLMDIPLERGGKSEAMRIGGILTRAGWRKDGKFKKGAYKDLSRYVPPPSPGGGA